MMDVGASIWSQCWPKLHSGFTCDAQWLCNCAQKEKQMSNNQDRCHFVFETQKKLSQNFCLRTFWFLFCGGVLFCSLTVIWHQRQCNPVIPLYDLTNFRHLLHFPVQFPSVQWCRNVCNKTKPEDLKKKICPINIVDRFETITVMQVK